MVGNLTIPSKILNKAILYLCTYLFCVWNNQIFLLMIKWCRGNRYVLKLGDATEEMLTVLNLFYKMFVRSNTKRLIKANQPFIFQKMFSPRKELVLRPTVLKVCLKIIILGSQWVVENGRIIRFWNDIGLGKKLLYEYLGSSLAKGRQPNGLGCLH